MAVRHIIFVLTQPKIIESSDSIFYGLITFLITMPACHLRPRDKKAFISAVGENLVQRHGRQKYYKPEQVRKSADYAGYAVDVHCWAYCLFTTPQDFKSLHEAAGETCDYVAMKAELLTDLASGDSSLPFDIDLSWLAWPDIDVSSLFDWFIGRNVNFFAL